MDIRKFWLSFTMVNYEKYIFKNTSITSTYDTKNNNAQLYSILCTANLHWNFSSIPKNGSDIHRFCSRKWVLTMCTVGNLWKFQCSMALPNIKYNGANMSNVLVIHLCFKVTIVKPGQNWLICLKTVRIYWASCRVLKSCLL